MTKKGSDAGFGILLVLGAIIAAVSAAYEWAKSNVLLVGLVVIVLALFLVLHYHLKRKRREERFRTLVERFGSEEIAGDIMDQKFWIGQSSEMLMESLGAPAAIDKQIMKTKRKEVWKYRQVRRNQFALRITLANDRVVGWDKKS